MFSFSQANADCGGNDTNCNNNNNLPDDSDQSPFYNNYYKTHSHEGVDDSESNIDDIHLKNSDKSDDILKGTDRIPVNCNVKDCTGHIYRCPDDFSSECYRVIDNDNHKGSDNHKGDGNHKSSDNNHNDNGKKFKVHVNLIYLNGVGGQHKFRVIVYGPHTLNKPTLDKPGYSFKLEPCDDDHCRFDLGKVSFTGWKVPKNTSFKACVWPSTSSHSSDKDCATGKATSRSVEVTVTVRN